MRIKETGDGAVRRLITIFGGGVLLCGASTLQSQSNDSIAVERAAVMAAVARAPLKLAAPPIIVSNSEIVREPAAPGADTGVAADTTRQGRPAGAIRARSIRRSEVITCTRSRCVMRDSIVVIALSPPLFNGDNAFVTTTLSTVVADGRVHRETVRWTLRRSGGTWAVIGQEQLGIS
jgi:hypothetical protein